MTEESQPPNLKQEGYPGNHAIAFCTDGNYWPHVATAIKSLFVHIRLPLPEIYVFYEQENLPWMRKLKRLSRVHRQTIHFRKFGLELIQNIEFNERFGSAPWFGTLRSAVC